MIDRYVMADVAEARGAAWVASVRPLCAYYEGSGSCSFGCWEEPVCHTEEPEDGWEAEAFRRYMDASGDLRWLIRGDRPRLTHGEVKHLRDQVREVERIAALCLRGPS